MSRPLFVSLMAALLIGCSAAVPVEAIAGLNDADTAAGTYRVLGYLVFLDDCGFCPPGAVCEPCAGPTFSVLAENQGPNVEWSNSTQELVGQLGTDHLLLSINLDDEDRLEQGVRYEMTVELTDNAPYGEGNRLAILLEYSEQR